MRDLKLLKIEEEISRNRCRKLSVFSIIPHLYLPDILEEEKNIEKFKIEIEKALDYWKIKVARLIERSDIENGKRIVSGLAFVEEPKNERNIWNIITMEDLDFQKNCIVRLIDLLSPRISRFYLTSSELKSIFVQLENEYVTIVKKAILYSHKEEGEISFEKIPYYELFNKAEETNRYVDKIEFVVRKNNKTMLWGFVTREGVSKFIGGDISFFYERFLPLIANYGEEKRKKLNKKEKNTETYSVKPLVLRFEKEIIRGKEDNKRIIDSLQNLPRSSILVYHANPYLHLSLLDFMDGSSCDVFVSSPDEISVIPYNSSLSSLMRVFNQLSKDFEEGEIFEKVKEDLQFSDFFT